MSPRPANSSASEPLRPLTDRVRERVAAAGLALDRRASASRPRARRARQTASARLSAPSAEEAAEARQAASLKQVFRELGETHRQYRQRTGQAATPPLREAAFAFKRAPTLPALVAVTAFFDELGILEW